MKPDGNFYSDEEMQAGEIQATINGLVARAESAESALSLLTAKLAQCEEKLAEMTARAMSLALHVPPETLCGAVQQWRDEVKAQLAAHAKALEDGERLRDALVPVLNEWKKMMTDPRCSVFNTTAPLRDALSKLGAAIASGPATTGKGVTT